jgi:hypothetical protein
VVAARTHPPLVRASGSAPTKVTSRRRATSARGVLAQRRTREGESSGGQGATGIAARAAGKAGGGAGGVGEERGGALGPAGLTRRTETPGDVRQGGAWRGLPFEGEMARGLLLARAC